MPLVLGRKRPCTRLATTWFRCTAPRRIDLWPCSFANRMSDAAWPTRDPCRPRRLNRFLRHVPVGRRYIARRSGRTIIGSLPRPLRKRSPGNSLGDARRSDRRGSIVLILRCGHPPVMAIKRLCLGDMLARRAYMVTGVAGNRPVLSLWRLSAGHRPEGLPWPPRNPLRSERGIRSHGAGGWR
jgi:hypothetical protein